MQIDREIESERGSQRREGKSKKEGHRLEPKIKGEREREAH